MEVHVATALVTGGAGFMGSHLVDHLVERMGMEVVVLDDLSGGFRDNVREDVRFVEGSILDEALIERLFVEHRFDYVYHLAAYAAEGLSHFIKRFNYRNNLIGSVNLVNASINHGVRCFVFTSSIAVYGAAQLPMREELVPVPEDPYGIAKLAVEQELRVSREMFGLEHVIFRPHNVYGLRQNLGDPYRNVVGIFMNRLMRGEELVVFGDGTQERAFTWVDDVVPALAESVGIEAAHGQVFNVGSDVHVSVADLARQVMDAMGISGELRHVEARNEVHLAWADHSRFKEVFGDVARTPLAEGLAEMAAWAKQVGARSGEPFEGIEVERNLPPFWRTIGREQSP
jgi:UDP-glucose 4-epimerase